MVNKTVVSERTRNFPASLAMFTGAQEFKAQESDSGHFYQWILAMTLNGHSHWRYRSEEGEGNFEQAAGDVMLVRPGPWLEWSVTQSDTSWHPVWTLFLPRPHWLEWLEEADFQHGIARVCLTDETLLATVRDGLLNLHQVYSRGGVHRTEWALLSLEDVLLSLHESHVLRCETPDARVQQAIEFLHAHFAQPLTMREAANAARLSEPHLSLLFRRQMKMAPMQYLDRLRLAHAKELLHFSSQRVSAIAHACGYRDTDYFSRHFKKVIGQTPREFRHSACRPRG